MFPGRLRIVVLILTLGADVAAQEYTPVFGSDISGQHVITGTAVEVRGWVWTNESGTYYNINLPSAQPKMRIDIAALPSEQRRLLTQTCFSSTQFAGGCSATLRGVVAEFEDRPGLLAHTLELDPN
jgi:hypothetical protein